MAKLLVSLLSGAVFGLGLAVSGMTDTQRVQNFLDVAGLWDPTLLFVMGSGLLTTFIGYRWVFKHPTPIFSETFTLPTKTRIDNPLWMGAALFGIGWGLVGYCPGPAIAGLSYGYTPTLVLLPAIIIGLLLARPIARLL
jgi:uncharacterized membrane protein YedE/YeeE